MKGKLAGNLAMGISKTFSGLNENALKFLLPTWMSAITGVAVRLAFGTVSFWIYGLFSKRKPGEATASPRDRLELMLLGAVCMFGYMYGLLGGLTYTTPIASSIFLSLEPVFVFLLCVIFYKEKVTRNKIIGIAIGLSGALLCILTQKSSDVASNPLLGDIFCIGGALFYSIYLVISGRFLKRLSSITVSKWSFTGGLITGGIAVAISGWDAPIFQHEFFSLPMLVLAFVLLFPTSISYLLVDVGLKHLSPTVVALYGYVILIVATITSYILGQDHFDWWQIIAIALIVASVYFVELAESKTSAPKVSDPKAGEAETSQSNSAAAKSSAGGR